MAGSRRLGVALDGLEVAPLNQLAVVGGERKRQIRIEAEASAPVDDGLDCLLERDGPEILDDLEGKRFDFGDEVQRFGDEVVNLVAGEHVVVGK